MNFGRELSEMLEGNQRKATRNNMKRRIQWRTIKKKEGKRADDDVRHCGPAWKESAYQGQRDARPIGGTTTPFGRDRLVPIGRPPSSSSAKQQGTKEKLFCFLRHRHHFLNCFEFFVIKIKLNELNFNFYFYSIHFAWKRTSFEVVNIWKREKNEIFEAFQ